MAILAVALPLWGIGFTSCNYGLARDGYDPLYYANDPLYYANDVAAACQEALATYRFWLLVSGALMAANAVIFALYIWFVTNLTDNGESDNDPFISILLLLLIGVLPTVRLLSWLRAFFLWLNLCAAASFQPIIFFGRIMLIVDVATAAPQLCILFGKRF